MKVTASDGETQTIKDVSLIIRQQQDEKMQKKLKPPLSLKSPAFEKQQHEPHELSTIAEIETPTASKVNLIPDEVSGVGAIHSFPNFEEYAKENENNNHPIEMSISYLGKSADKNDDKVETSFPNLNDLKSALPDMNIKTFVGQEILVDLSKNVQEDDSNVPSSASSLIDIMEELKKQNLFQDSFHIYYEDENKEINLQAGCEINENTTPTTTQPAKVPTSPKRKQQAQSRIISMKTPEKVIQVEFEAKTPTKKPQKSKQHELPEVSPAKSNDTLSGIQEIEKDFQTQGQGWAASTLKRTEESYANNNKNRQVSSSSSGEKYGSIKIDVEYGDSSSSSSGHPLNLKDFLRRELLTRSKNDQYISDDSSLSAKFIKSLLNATDNLSSTSNSSAPKSDSSQNAKLRTSTPVRMSSENLVKTGASSQMFVGAESVSTVKDSDSSCKDKSDKSKSLNF